MDNIYPFVNTPLKYPYDALEPYIDEKTMFLHHDRHLQTYIDKLNELLKKNPRLQSMTLFQLLNNPCKLPECVREELCRNAGGVYNHRFYFNGMTPESREPDEGVFFRKIMDCFGGFDNFRIAFKNAAMGVFGSGYAWLVYDKGKLKITTTKNQDTPLCFGQIPVMNIDVWEHAYYLKNYNKRSDYIDNWFCVADWDMAEKRLARASCGFLM